jgi:hypothetical protein
MTERLSPLPDSAEPVATKMLNGQSIDIYQEAEKLPKGIGKVMCVIDLLNGLDDRVSEVFFNHGGCQYPVGEEDSIVRYRLECEGWSLEGGCALRAFQYDREGNAISQG